MHDLAGLILLFEEELVRRNCSTHTVTAYGKDLRRFHDHFALDAAGAPAITAFEVMEFDVTKMRGWLEGLHLAGLGASTICRHIATLRAFFQFVKHLGLIRTNPAKMLRRPRFHQEQPAVMSEKQVATILDGVKSFRQWNPPRDLAMLELLYGCGLRVSELVGLDLNDIDRSECWIRVRGKGKRERDVPYPKGAAKEALESYLAMRNAPEEEEAVFISRRGNRLTDRSARSIVKGYGAFLAGDSSIHPHSFRHAYATHLLDHGASLRAIQKLLGHENLRATSKYTQVSITRMVGIYDKAHPSSR